ncbi:MAG: hypothetical protein AB1705_25745, partial [Verrucomicrobiota bacterium]
MRFLICDLRLGKAADRKIVDRKMGSATSEEVRQGKNVGQEASWRGRGVGAFAVNQLLQITGFVVS